MVMRTPKCASVKWKQRKTVPKTMLMLLLSAEIKFIKGIRSVQHGPLLEQNNGASPLINVNLAYFFRHSHGLCKQTKRSGNHSFGFMNANQLCEPKQLPS